MTMPQSEYHPGGAPPARRSLRWLPLLAVSLLLHALLLGMADGWVLLPGAAPAAPAATRIVTATLSAPAPPAIVAPPPTPAPAEPAPAPKPRKPRPRAQPAAKPAVVEAPAVPAAVATQAETVAPAPAVPAAEPGTVPDAIVASDAATPGDTGTTADARTGAATGAESTPPNADPATTRKDASTTPAAAAPAANGSQGQPGAPPLPQYRVSAPPTATLAFELRYATRGSITRGSSTIAWRLADGGYAIHGEITKFGFALSSFRSEGMIDAAGIAPMIYAEKNARRSETNTHFLRDARQAISFSASTETFPLAAGAQDRASILWQLSGIGRGDPAQFMPGGKLEIFVAGVRDAERWRIDIVGEETVTLENGTARAWHLVRASRAGTYDKRIDIWLAPAQEWYPVKLRYTEVSGDYLDLSLSAVR